MMKNKSIVLIGMAGVGKSTIGKLLADRLGWAFTDLDKILEADGRTTQQMIDDRGEQAFLALEKQKMFEVALNRRVVAPGGSIIYHPDLMEYLKQQCLLIYLYDMVENIVERVRKRGTRGIVGLANKSFEEIFEERQPLYSQYAHMTVSVQGKSPEAIVEHIISYVQCQNWIQFAVV